MTIIDQIRRVKSSDKKVLWKLQIVSYCVPPFFKLLVAIVYPLAMHYLDKLSYALHLSTKYFVYPYRTQINTLFAISWLLAFVVVQLLLYGIRLHLKLQLKEISQHSNAVVSTAILLTLFLTLPTFWFVFLAYGTLPIIAAYGQLLESGTFIVGSLYIIFYMEVILWFSYFICRGIGRIEDPFIKVVTLSIVIWAFVSLSFRHIYIADSLRAGMKSRNIIDVFKEGYKHLRDPHFTI